jgi:hypothetical protein
MDLAIEIVIESEIYQFRIFRNNSDREMNAQKK